MCDNDLDAKPAPSSRGRDGLQSWRKTENAGDEMGKKLRIVLIVVCLGVMCFSGWNIVRELREYQQGDEAYQELTQYVVQPTAAQPEAPEPRTAPERSGDPAPTEEVSAAPVDDTPWPEVDFEALSRINPDLVGWLYGPDTEINYPVVHTTDNSYYLHHRFDGEEHKSGCLFIDADNLVPISDPNTVIYGHHLKNGSMFGGLTKYSKQEYYEEHPEFLYLTSRHRYHLRAFAGYVCPSDGDAWRLLFFDAAERDAWIQKAIQSSTFQSGLVPGPRDLIVTLSTCSYDFEDARYVLLCIMEKAD